MTFRIWIINVINTGLLYNDMGSSSGNGYSRLSNVGIISDGFHSNIWAKRRNWSLTIHGKSWNCICFMVDCIDARQIHYFFLSTSYQIRSVAQSCPTLFDPMNRSTPGLPVITNSQSSLRLTSIESVMPSSHLILCRPLLLLPPIPPSIRVFANESALRMRWPKYFIFDALL